MPALDPISFPLKGTRLIEASAGTGKTYAITNLYIRLLLGDETPVPLSVKEILVLTFTKAATQELKKRIRQRISQARQAFEENHSEDAFFSELLIKITDRDRAVILLSSAMQLMDESSIFTIHSFCNKILREHSFETGTLFNLDLDADRNVLLQQAAEDFYRSDILTMTGMEYQTATKLWPSPDSVALVLNNYLWRPELTLIPGPEDLSEDIRKYQETIEKVKQLWVSDGIEHLLRDAGLKASSKSLKPAYLDPLNHFMQGTSSVQPEWDCWTSEYIGKNVKKGNNFPDHPIFELIDFIHEQSLTLSHRIEANLIHRALVQIRARMEEFKSQQMQLTLDDLLNKVRDALDNSPGLPDTLSILYPAALVDEFQDTDDVQYQIFQKISQAKSNIFYVGDPKQAIYYFRGADVYTYIHAKRQIENDGIYQLGINWRSSRQLIDAINHLFDKEGLFGNEADIPYQPVAASPQCVDNGFLCQGKPAPPVTLFNLETADKYAKTEAISLLCEWTAEQIAELLNSANKKELLVNDNPLTAGQISVLVRDRKEASLVKTALGNRHIQSVYLTQDSVFHGDTADDLSNLLLAVIDPANETKIRAALATPLLQSSISEINALDHDMEIHQSVLSEFADYHNTWASKNIAPMISELIQRRRLNSRWLSRPDGHRQLTNLRHLTEILQQQAGVNPGMQSLVNWFNRQRLENALDSEERQLRMESDQDLVQIVTMHSAKGLEYDVVFVPAACFISTLRKNEHPLFHEAAEGNFHLCVDLAPGKNSNSHRIALTEKRDEDMRLLYVAITRAKLKCFLGMANISRGDNQLVDSALAKILAIPPQTKNSEAVGEYLQSAFCEPLFEVLRLAQSPGLTKVVWSSQQAKLTPPGKTRQMDFSWHTQSYTRLANLLGSADEKDDLPVITLSGYGDDDSDMTPEPDLNLNRFDRFSFPKGARTGIMLHHLLEQLDECRDDAGLTLLCKNRLKRFGLVEAEWIPVLADWIKILLNTPLTSDADFTLSNITAFSAEMEFHFPINESFRLSRLISLLNQHQYLQEKTFSIEKVTGMMTGLIDLIIEYKGQYFLADYKSNHLGDSSIDYKYDALTEAIKHHNYDLQYLIYTLAIHRYLRQQLPDYNYEQHFGGVLYLFLRGMDGEEKSGVYFDKPDIKLITELDSLFGV